MVLRGLKDSWKLCVLAVLAIGAAGCSQDSAEADEFVPHDGDEPRVHLRLNLTEGLSYTEHSEMHQVVKQEVGKFSMRMEQESTFVTRFEVKEIDEEGNARLEGVYERVRFRFDNDPGVAMTFDSADPDGSAPEIKHLGAMVGTKLSFTLDPQGKVTRITGITDMQQAIMEAASDRPAAEREMMRQMFEEMFSEEQLMEAFTHSPGYPDRPIGVGARWRETTEFEYGLPMKVDGRFTLSGRDAGVTTIEGRKAISSQDREHPLPGGHTMRARLEGTGESSIEVDETTGMVLRMKSTNDIKGPVTYRSVQGDREDGIMHVRTTIISRNELE